MAHFANLNSAQLSAVKSEAQVVQVLAPPGSGKTKTLTCRVAYLLGDQGFLPWNVICLTFTIKSAREMKERLTKLIGEGIGNKIILGTFHSVCRRYLAYYGHLIGLKKGFGIADTSDTKGIITRIIKRNKFGIEAKSARSRISSCKARKISWEDELRQTTASKKGVDQHEFVTVYQQYEEYLELSNLLDYDDLLLRCLKLLETHPECINNVEAVLIDEFQDTNHVQFDLMKAFAHRCNHITTVGDPDQSIYGWRNAEITNLTKMQTIWNETLVINLEQNYRSAGAILEVAQKLIEQDTTRHQKALAAVHCQGVRPVLRKLPSASIEAEWITSEIKRSMVLGAELLNHSDFAILLRTASLSRQIESTFGKHGIPYRMVGGVKFFDRVEVKLLLDYLRVVAQPSNSDALARIINVPARRIGTSTVKALLAEAIEAGCTVWDLVRKAAQGSHINTKITTPQLLGLSSLVNIILTCQDKLSSTDKVATPRTLLELLVKKLDFMAFLEKNYKEDHELRWENVEQLYAQADDPLYTSLAGPDSEDVLPELEDVEQQLPPGPLEILARFLANVALSTEKPTEEETDGNGNLKSKVTISTIHAAKGLEWPVVFIPACYEGNIPHSRAENTDEERRLLYVAMTRAKALLYMSCPMRNSMGEETAVSSFVDDPRVKKRFDRQGHMFEYDIIADIASILGRDCPQRTNLVAALRESGLEHILDDRWPLDGQREATENDVLWTNTEKSLGFQSAFTGHKRRKISEKEASVAAQSQVRSMLYSNTTMGSASNFTIPNPSVGFVSATKQMQIQRGIDAAKEETKVAGPETSMHDTVPGLTKSSKPRATKRETGQSSLASWFGGGKPAAAKPRAQESLSARPEPTESTTVPEPPPLISQLVSKPLVPNFSRQPMSIASPVVINRPMRPLSSPAPLRKPLLTLLTEKAPTNSCNNLSIHSTEMDGAGQPPTLRLSPESADQIAATQGSVVKAAVTTHTTTLSRLGNPQGPGPRRLGMKGAMAPWSAKNSRSAVRPSNFQC